MARKIIFNGLMFLLCFARVKAHSQAFYAPINLIAITAAVSQTTPTPAASIPQGAVFYSAQNPFSPPLPGNINGLDAWNIGTNVYLLDDLDFDYQARQQSYSAGRGFRANDADDDAPAYVPFSIDTNGLWLEITNVTTTLAYLNLHNATNQVYAIWTTTNLPGGWTVEAEVWPTNSTVQPFTLDTDGRPNLFVRAQDWTGFTENSNTVPDWWFWDNFGTTALADTNLDTVGQTYLSDYQTETDPNIIQFSLVTTNNYSTTPNVPINLNIYNGIPFYTAIVLDDTNFQADAAWQAYSGTNITVNLGLTEGWHTIWIGLTGHSANSSKLWQRKRINLDWTPPQLVITYPTMSTISVPLVQISGFSPEPLQYIYYDLTNSAGCLTHQHASVCEQFFNTNTAEFTTNYFACVDVPLTNGWNTITLHAADRAGNLTSTNFSILMDASSRTNPPAVVLYWPNNGAQIGATNYTWRGWVDDPTASVIAQQVDGSGNTNFYQGLVERTGNFWLDNLPLNGTNWLTLTVTDSASNVFVTNIVVSASSLSLTIDPPDTNNLWNPTLTVTGTISDSYNFTVWVNGVTATLNGDGTWTATNAPMPDGGAVLIQARAIPNSDNGGNGTSGAGGSATSYADSGNPIANQATDSAVNADKPCMVVLKTFSENKSEIADDYYRVYSIGSTISTSTQHAEYSQSLDWKDGGGGNGSIKNFYHENGSNYLGDDGGYTNAYTLIQTWPATSWPNLVSGTQTDSGAPDESASIPPPHIVWKRGSTSTSYSHAWSDLFYAPYDNVFEDGSNSGNVTKTAETSVVLKTGGRAKSKQKNVFGLTGSASQIILTNFGFFIVNLDTLYSDIPTESLQIDGRSLGAEGVIYSILPDNSEEDITVEAKGVDFYSFSVSASKYLSYFDLFVLQANPGYSPLPSGINDVGHVFWRFRTDAPIDITNYLSSSLANYLGNSYGFYPASNYIVGPGMLVQENKHEYNINRYFSIGWSGLVSGLQFTRQLDRHPPEYEWYFDNCVYQARLAGYASGVHILPLDLSPQIFGIDLTFMYWGPFLSDQIFYP